MTTCLNQLASPTIRFPFSSIFVLANHNLGFAFENGGSLLCVVACMTTFCSISFSCASSSAIVARGTRSRLRCNYSHDHAGVTNNCRGSSAAEWNGWEGREGRMLRRTITLVFYYDSLTSTEQNACIRNRDKNGLLSRSPAFSLFPREARVSRGCRNTYCRDLDKRRYIDFVSSGPTAA